MPDSPRLFNAHVHFFERKWSNVATLDAEELNAQLADFSQFGFSGVFDLSSDWDNTNALRERIQSGEVRGPRIFSTGEGLMPPGGLPPPIVSRIMGIEHVPLPEVSDVASAHAQTRALLSRGVDAVKVFLSNNAGDVRFAPDALRAVVDAAHAAGKRVFVHPNDADDVLVALQAGVDVLAHTTPRSGGWSDEILAFATERKAALIPTLMLWQHALRHDRISLAQRTVDAAVEQLRAWRAAGGTVLFGTDLGAVGPDPAEEYALMHRAGMSADDILASQTTTPAEFFGLSSRA